MMTAAWKRIDNVWIESVETQPVMTQPVITQPVDRSLAFIFTDARGVRGTPQPGARGDTAYRKELQ